MGASEQLTLGSPGSLGKSSALPHVLLAHGLSETIWLGECEQLFGACRFQHRARLCSDLHVTDHPGEQTNGLATCSGVPHYPNFSALLFHCKYHHCSNP